jgi:hypothetical protein
VEFEGFSISITGVAVYSGEGEAEFSPSGMKSFHEVKKRRDTDLSTSVNQIELRIYRYK